MSETLSGAIADVLARDACTGCGFCTHLGAGIRMQTTAAGYRRPVVGDLDESAPSAVATFRRACPGVTVSAHRPHDARRHALLGSYFEAWEARPTDPAIRFAGSSGGVLTALTTWRTSTGRAASVVSAAADQANPRRTVSVTIQPRSEALAAAGSSYAPVVTPSHPAAFQSGTAIVGKPCEISAARAACPADQAPNLLSFFCAGTPSTQATDAVLHDLGIAPDQPVDRLWYRGRGWPGRFTATVDGDDVSIDYESSWGKTLGPTTQWRCKVCPDGVGEAADIVAADSWATDDRGYPLFVESDGVSALIARTERGRDLILEAIEEGVIAARPLAMGQLEDAQPLQTSRRRFLLARLIGSALTCRRTPRTRWFALWRLRFGNPRTISRIARGMNRRVRAARGRS